MGAQLSDGTVDVHIAELLNAGAGRVSSVCSPCTCLVHVVGVGSAVIAQPDAVVLHLYN